MIWGAILALIALALTYTRFSKNTSVYDEMKKFRDDNKDSE